MWPTLDQYQSAVQHPEWCFQDPLLQNAYVEKQQYGLFSLPFARAGNFGAVYKFQTPGRDWAVKIFIRENTERHRRYSLISDAMKVASVPGFIGFDYNPEGIQINGAWFPILMMEWAEGKTLDKYLEDTFNQNELLDNERLCQNMIMIFNLMQEKGIAHGDLQHGNILVGQDSKITLVDYDGMYVPSMAGMKAIEIGLPAYQHPQRSPSFFNSCLDNFSILIILLQVMTASKPIWQMFHKDDNHLLITKFDLLDPEHSEFFNCMASLSEKAHAKKRKLARTVQQICKTPIEHTPHFMEVIKELERGTKVFPVSLPCTKEDELWTPTEKKNDGSTIPSSVKAPGWALKGKNFLKKGPSERE